MANYKMDRTSEDILRELTAILRRVKDPRVSGMISIVRVEVSNDMSYAGSWGAPCICAMCRSCASSRTIPSPTAPV